MRRDRWEELYALAEEQHAAFTTAQAAELQIDAHMRSRAQRDGLVDRLRPRVWAVRGLIDDWTPMAGVQLAHPRAVGGFRAAARVHRFDGLEADALDVLVPPNVWLRGATVHHVTDLVVPEIVVIDGMRFTDEVRTLIDYAALVDDEHLERAMESVLRQAPQKRALLVDRASALARPGKSGPARVLRVERNLSPRRTESDLETVYWQELRRYGVDLPVRQHPVGQLRLDNAYPREKVFVELDGYATHGNREAFGNDRRRQNVIVSLGWVPLRFTDSDVRGFGRRTAAITANVLRQRRLLMRGVA